MINILDTVLDLNKHLESSVKEAGGELIRVKDVPEGPGTIELLSRRYAVSPDKTSALSQLLGGALGAVHQGLMNSIPGTGPIQWEGFSVIINTHGDAISLHASARIHKPNKGD